MATYNRAFVLKETIKNIFDQDYPNLELIVVNDGSDDHTQTVLEGLQSFYGFKLIRNPKNLGLQQSLNRGIQQANGKYIARIDDHDRWLTKDKISKQVNFLEKNTEYGMVGTAYQVGSQKMLNPETDEEVRQQILMRCPFCHVTVLIRKSAIEAVGGYDEKLPYSEDWDLWLKIGTKTKFANMPDITVEVAEAETSLSGDYFTKQLPLNRRVIKPFLKKYPSGWKAQLYHQFLYIFFSIVPIGGVVHRMMQSVFKMVFLKA